MIPTKNSNPSECSNISSNCVIWQGPDIACIDICTGDTISVVVAKLAEQLCAILDGVDPDLSGLDLACVLPEGELAPTSIQDTFQLIIDYICGIEPEGKYSLPDLLLPECLHYNDPETEELITILPLDDYALLLATKICDILDSIAIINSTLTNHETRLITLENCVLPCNNDVGEVDVVSYCILGTTTPAPLSELVLALEIRFCDLETAVGTPALIANALNNACIDGSFDRLNGVGTYDSLPTWVDTPVTLAETVNNLWAVVCDMHAAVTNIQLNCCPGACDSIVFDYAVSPILDGAGQLTSLEFVFNASSIPSGFSDCGGSTTIVLTDSNGLQANQVFNFGTYAGTTTPLTVSVGSLNKYDDITTSIDFCVTNDIDECDGNVTKVVSLGITCPTNIAGTPDPNGTDVVVTFTNYLGTTSYYNIEIVNNSTGITEASTTVNTPGINVNETLTGLTANTTYYVKVTAFKNGSNTVCESVTFSTPEVVVDPPCDSGIDLAILIDYTGSMGSQIEAVKSGLVDLITTVDTASGANDYRMGFAIVDETANEADPTYVSSVDYTSLPPSQAYVNTASTPNSDIYITAMEMLSINNGASFTTQLNKINDGDDFPIGNGQNVPEPMDVALGLTINSNFLGVFRNNVAKYVVMVTDATPSGLDDEYTPAIDDVAVQALRDTCIAEGIKIIVLGSGASNSIYQDLATATGGSFNTSFDANTIETEIENLCGVETVDPDPEPDCTTYIASTTSGTGILVSYVDCNGEEAEVSLGGASGFDQETFCARSIISSGGATISIEGDCPTGR